MMGVRERLERMGGSQIKKAASAYDCLRGGGEMGALMRSVDWEHTPLGDVQKWPQSLRTSVGICLDCGFGICLWWGPELAFLYNDTYRPILGDKHPAALGRPGREIWGEVWDVIGPMLDSVIRTGTATQSRDLLLCLERSGYKEECYFEFSYSPIRDETGSVAGIFTPVTETTERVIGERRLRTLRDLGSMGVAENVVKACQMAAATLSLNPSDVPFSAIYLMEGAGRALLACTSGVRSETDSLPCIVDLTGDESRWPIASVVRDRTPKVVRDIDPGFSGFVEGIWPDPVRSAVLLPVTPPGRDSPAAVLIAGVSPRKELDDSYQGFYDLVASHIAAGIAQTTAYEQERKRAESLAELDAAKTAFFSNASHELRTPLTLVMGPLEDILADSAGLPARHKIGLETARRNAVRLLKLVKALLDFSRIEAHRLQGVYEAADLSKLTADVASTFRSAIERARLGFTVDCPALSEPVYVDREMWEKIVLNLLSNALKFTLTGEIVLAVRIKESFAELTITDTGVGILEDELPRIFERFYRVEGKRGRTQEGTGIGLALVQELVRLHGGTVSVDSKENAGSCFTVRIPLGKQHLPQEMVGDPRSIDSTAVRAEVYVEEALRWLPNQEAQDTPVQKFDGSKAAGDGRPRVVVADDNADMREYLARLLSDRYDVVTAANGEQALRMVAADPPPALVLLDVMMPALDGFAVLREIRSDARFRTMPVILLSARAGEEAQVEGLAAGADDYLVKPFNGRELMARVSAHIELARVRSSAEQQERQLRAVAESANRMLQLANEELRQFSFAVSHDLQAPIRMIGMYTQLLAKRVDRGDEVTATSIEYILSGVQRMRSLITDLLSYSQVLHGDSEPDVPVDTLAVFHQALMIHQPVIQETQARITAGELPVVLFNWSQMLQVFQNLIGNGLKYRHPDRTPHVVVSSVARGSEFLFSVTDNGMGFDPQYASQIFGMFKRLHGEGVPGTGLGLAICKRLIEKRGGRIWAESKPGAGSQFHFTVSAG